MNIDCRFSLSTYRRAFESGRAFYVSLTLFGLTVWLQRWSKAGGQPNGRVCLFNPEFTWKAGVRR